MTNDHPSTPIRKRRTRRLTLSESPPRQRSTSEPRESRKKNKPPPQPKPRSSSLDTISSSISGEKKKPSSEAVTVEPGIHVPKAASEGASAVRLKRCPRPLPEERIVLMMKSCISGQRAGIEWKIFFDSPLGHSKKRMHIVKGVETFEDDDEDDDQQQNMAKMASPQQSMQFGQSFASMPAALGASSCNFLTPTTRRRGVVGQRGLETKALKGPNLSRKQGKPSSHQNLVALDTIDPSKSHQRSLSTSDHRRSHPAKQRRSSGQQSADASNGIDPSKPVQQSLSSSEHRRSQPVKEGNSSGQHAGDESNVAEASKSGQPTLSSSNHRRIQPMKQGNSCAQNSVDTSDTTDPSKSGQPALSSSEHRRSQPMKQRKSWGPSVDTSSTTDPSKSGQPALSSSEHRRSTPMKQKSSGQPSVDAPNTTDPSKSGKPALSSSEHRRNQPMKQGNSSGQNSVDASNTTDTPKSGQPPLSSSEHRRSRPMKQRKSWGQPSAETSNPTDPSKSDQPMRSSSEHRRSQPAKQRKASGHHSVDTSITTEPSKPGQPSLSSSDERRTQLVQARDRRINNKPTKKSTLERSGTGKIVKRRPKRPPPQSQSASETPPMTSGVAQPMKRIGSRSEFPVQSEDDASVKSSDENDKDRKAQLSSTDNDDDDDDEGSIDPMDDFLPRQAAESRLPKLAKLKDVSDENKRLNFLSEDESEMGKAKASSEDETDRLNMSTGSIGVNVRTGRRHNRNGRRSGQNGTVLRQPSGRTLLTGSLHSRSAHGEGNVEHGPVTKLAGTFAKGFGLQKVASVRSMSSSETTTTCGIEPGVAAEFMQFTLGEKGFVQRVGTQEEIKSSHTRRLANAVAESEIANIAMNDAIDEGDECGSNDEISTDNDEDDLNHRGLPEQVWKSKAATSALLLAKQFSHMAVKKTSRKAPPRAQSDLGSDALKTQKDGKKKKGFLQAAHASFMRAASDEEGAPVEESDDDGGKKKRFLEFAQSSFSFRKKQDEPAAFGSLLSEDLDDDSDDSSRDEGPG